MLTKSCLFRLTRGLLGRHRAQPVRSARAQVQQALPDETLQKVAEPTPASPRTQAASDLARTLPQAVDKLTPEGQVPQAASLEELVRQQSL